MGTSVIIRRRKIEQRGDIKIKDLLNRGAISAISDPFSMITRSICALNEMPDP